MFDENIDETESTDTKEKSESKEIVKATYEVNKLDEKNFIEIDDLTEKVEKISEKIKIT